jgi:hypothetical protein
LKAVYDSAWHHPFVAYLVGLWLLAMIVRQLPFLYGYMLAFLVAILADATATGGWSPVPQATPAYTVFSVVFIVLGDLRYFVLAERVTHPDRSIGRVLAWAMGVSMIMPVMSGLLTRMVPAMQNDRVLYLVYEAAMGCIVLGLDRFRYAGADVPIDVRAWVHRVSLLFAGLYFGWAASDLVLLLGIEAGHIMRVIPNVLYYGAFLPFVFLGAPARMRDIELRQEVA